MWADTGNGVLFNLAQLASIEALDYSIVAYKHDGSVAFEIALPETDSGRRAIEDRLRRIRRILQDGRGIAELGTETNGMTAADLVRNHERVRAARQ